MKKDLTTADAIGCVFALIWFPALLVAGYLLRGWALAYLWLWFVVPFFGLPAMGIAQAIGLAIVVGFLTKEHDTDSKCKAKEDDHGVWFIIFKTSVNVALPPLLAYLTGAIVRMWL